MPATNPVTFRDPTCEIPWPFLLLAGGEKVGKTWRALAFSASSMVGMTYFIEVGEGDADQYGLIPGARYKIAQHDGSYRQILAAVKAAKEQPTIDGKPNLIVFDSKTEFWDLLTQEQQEVANRRRNKDDASITMDQWNLAKKRWRKVLKELRTHEGPVIVTARMEQVTVMDDDGKPTTAKEWKVRAEKNLGFEVSGTVQMPHWGESYLAGIRSPIMKMNPEEVRRLPNDWTIEWLMEQLGLNDPNVKKGSRQFVEPDAAKYAEEAAKDPREAAQAIIDQAAKASDTGTIADLLGQAEDAELLYVKITLGGHEGRLQDALNYVYRQVAARENDDQGATDQRADESPGQAEQRAQEANARADERQDTRADAQETRANSTGQTREQNAPQTGKQKLVARAEDEIAFQAEALGRNIEQHMAPLVKDTRNGQVSDVTQANIEQWVREQRPAVAEALRQQGNASLAHVYERAPFPVSMEDVFERADAEAARENEREREPANA